MKSVRECESASTPYLNDEVLFFSRRFAKELVLQRYSYFSTHPLVVLVVSLVILSGQDAGFPLREWEWHDWQAACKNAAHHLHNDHRVTNHD